MKRMFMLLIGTALFFTGCTKKEKKLTQEEIAEGNAIVQEVGLLNLVY